MRAVTAASWPSSRSRAQIPAVRRSCQTIARCSGMPVRRFQTSVVSRWLVMPMAAIASAPIPAFATASRQVAATVDQRSSGSCSTHPERGKCCANSSWALATTRSSESKRMARLEVVPWSMASTCDIRSLPLARRRRRRLVPS